MSSNQELVVHDFHKICRTCLGEGEMKHLFEKCSKEVSLIEMLISVTLLECNENDGLPVQICLKCEKEINRAYKFIKKCSEVDNALRKCINHFIEKSSNNRTLTYQKQNKVEDKNKTTECVKEQNSEIADSHYFAQNKISKTDNFDTEKTLPTLKSFECKYCYEKFPSLQLLKLHRKEKKDTPNKSCGRKICKICSKSVPYSRINEHIRFHVKRCRNTIIDERYCKAKYPVTKGIKSDKKKQKTFSCTICDLTFETFADLKIHRLTVGHSHKRIVYSCPFCNKKISFNHLVNHLRIHINKRPEFICNTCHRKFDFKCNLRRHVMIHTGERPHRCHICNKGFIQVSSLIGHLQSHSGEKRFVCNICGEKFTQNGNMRRHLKNHTNTDRDKNKSEPIHECEICHQKFRSKGVLKTHMLIHGDKTWLCSYCGKGFVSLAGLNSHLKMHSNDRPYSCELCGKSFGHLGSLKLHIHVHTGEKPFVCKLCNKAFKQQSHLKIHLRTHSGDRPYSCSVCGKTFALNSNLTVHMRTHTGETPYLCPVCGKGFYDSSSMKKHLNNHGEEFI